MTSEEFRKKLNNFIVRARLQQSITSINKGRILENLINNLNNPEFVANASIEELYDFRKRLFQLQAFSSGLVKAIEDSKLIFFGEFEDQALSLEEVGITSQNFICIQDFTDPFNELNINVGTEIRVEELSYANESNMITAYYTKLISDSSQKDMIEIFENGNQPTLLNLKILELNFNQI
jgi:hypothetical protein